MIMVQYIQDSGLMINEMEEEFKLLMMALFMKVIGEMIWLMEKEDKFMETIIYTKEILKTIISMALDN